MTEAAKPVGYLDEKGEFHRSPQFHFLGLVDESCGSRDHIWSGTSLAEAGEAWKRFVAQGSKDVDLTGWGCGIIASHCVMSRQFTEASGTFACPICEKDAPHQHSAEVVAFHRDNEKWSQELHVKAWQQAEARVAALEARYPPRTPLYAHPPTAGVNPSQAPGSDVDGAVAALENARVLLESGTPDDVRQHITHAIGLLRPSGVAVPQTPKENDRG
jgi:hypothetical protein